MPIPASIAAGSTSAMPTARNNWFGKNAPGLLAGTAVSFSLRASSRRARGSTPRRCTARTSASGSRPSSVAVSALTPSHNGRRQNPPSRTRQVSFRPAPRQGCLRPRFRKRRCAALTRSLEPQRRRLLSRNVGERRINHASSFLCEGQSTGNVAISRVQSGTG